MTPITQAMATPKGLAIMMILFTVTTNAAAQVMLKQGMMTVGEVNLTQGSLVQTVLRIGLQPWVILGLTTFAISMASHLVVLSKVELSFAYPFLSLAYIMVAAFSFFVFGEDITVTRLAGYGLICVGTLVIAMT